eukprot:m.53306 g.53306  ORF g.53306 m.53306 type:complete len:519 (+) comp6757_c0_seq2:151-1707(+)
MYRLKATFTTPDGSVTLPKHTVVDIAEKNESGWWYARWPPGEWTGATWVPSTYLRLVAAQDAQQQQQQQPQQQQQDAPQDAPPPRPPKAAASADAAAADHTSTTAGATSASQENDAALLAAALQAADLEEDDDDDGEDDDGEDGMAQYAVVRKRTVVQAKPLPAVPEPEPEMPAATPAAAAAAADAHMPMDYVNFTPTALPPRRPTEPQAQSQQQQTPPVVEPRAPRKPIPQPRPQSTVGAPTARKAPPPPGSAPSHASSEAPPPPASNPPSMSGARVRTNILDQTASQAAAHLTDEERRDLEQLRAELRDFQPSDGFRSTLTLLHHGPLKKLSKGKVQKRHFFLFDNLLVYGKREKKKIDLRGVLSMCDTTIQDVEDGVVTHNDAALTNAIEVHNKAKGKWLILLCDTLYEKKEWLDNFQLERKIAGALQRSLVRIRVTLNSMRNFGFNLTERTPGQSDGCRVSKISDQSLCPGLMVGDHLWQLDGIIVKGDTVDGILEVFQRLPAGRSAIMFVQRA